MIAGKKNEKLWSFFDEFTGPEADRYSLLDKLFRNSSLEYQSLNIAENRHILIVPKAGEEHIRRRPTILTAHYDRANNSPGANDNSAAVFMLIETALNLKHQKTKNWAIILTDKEELSQGERIQDQGSFTLAKSFRAMNMENARVFNFDACGTGDTIIISATAEYLLHEKKSSPSIEAEQLRRAVGELQEIALKAAQNLGTAKYILTETPFSADAGFLRAGIAAQTITMLPEAECSLLTSALRKNHSLAESLLSGKNKETAEDDFYPETWKNMNGPNDTGDKLTPENFSTVISFAEELCKI